MSGAHRHALLVRWVVGAGEATPGEDPLGGSQWFAFLNRRATQIKVLGFEAGGYWIWSKRLERGHFARLMTRDGRVKRALCATEFLALLEGVDVEIKRQRKRYRTAA
ncbi:MAG: IS66 family insertion sequence element accessory protein TnpB [Pseudomonadales bacterium]|nr:IS66 family insertion sequence element accessory protein TnpB [Pseudomonadales bacterium]